MNIFGCLESEIAKAFITAYEEQAQSIFENYLDNAEAFTTKSKMKGPNYKRRNESLMKTFMRGH